MLALRTTTLRPRPFLRAFTTLRQAPIGLYAHEHGNKTTVSLSTNPDAVAIGSVHSLGLKNADEIQPDKFETNKQFMKIVQDAIMAHVHEDPVYTPLAQAEGKEAAHFAIYDLRNPPPQARVAAVEDTLGHVRLDHAKIINQSYEPNDFYRVLTSNGFIHLSDKLNRIIKKECEK